MKNLEAFKTSFVRLTAVFGQPVFADKGCIRDETFAEYVRAMGVYESVSDDDISKATDFIINYGLAFPFPVQFVNAVFQLRNEAAEDLKEAAKAAAKAATVKS